MHLKRIHRQKVFTHAWRGTQRLFDQRQNFEFWKVLDKNKTSKKHWRRSIVNKLLFWVFFKGCIVVFLSNFQLLVFRWEGLCLHELGPVGAATGNDGPLPLRWDRLSPLHDVTQQERETTRHRGRPQLRVRLLQRMERFVGGYGKERVLFN